MMHVDVFNGLIDAFAQAHNLTVIRTKAPEPKAEDKKPEDNTAGPCDKSAEDKAVENCPCSRCVIRRMAAVSDTPARERSDLRRALMRTFRYLSRFKNEEIQAELGLRPEGKELSSEERSAVFEIIQNLVTATKSIQFVLGALAAFEALQFPKHDTP